MSAPVPIDTLIEDLQRAKAEGADSVFLQVNGAEGVRRGEPSPRTGARMCWQAVPRFSFHSSLMVGVYVIGGDRFDAGDWIRVDESSEGRPQ